MTKVEVKSPRVIQISDDRIPELTVLIDSWRDAMPALEQEALTASPHTALAVLDGETIVGGYILLHVPMANEIATMAVNPDCRLQGLGRLMCMDALFRSGKRPLVLTVNDTSLPFARAVGFKLVGKRRQPDGSFLTRLGWHAPRPSEEPKSGASHAPE